MAASSANLDVWIVESNTVYKGVPFTVIADWIQQGRLLDDDMVRPTGKGDWVTIAATPALAPYLPRPEPLRVEDTAAALESVGLDFNWKKRHEEEDDDVDMIPLIDVSLVLLIFFMLTAAAGVGVAAMVPTYEARNPTVNSAKREITIDIDLKHEGDDRFRPVKKPHEPVYSLSIDQKPPKEDARNLTSQSELIARLKEALANVPHRIEVTYNAHHELEDGIVLDLLTELEKHRGKILVIHTGVRER